MNASQGTNDQVMSHRRLSHVTRINGQYLKIYMRPRAQTNWSCHTDDWVMSHVWMDNTLRYGCVTWHKRIGHVTQTIECIGYATRMHEPSHTLQHTATHCDTLQHTTTHCTTPHNTTTHCNTLQHTVTHCNTLWHTATRCNTLQHTTTHCNTLQLTATHCNTLQHTATHCNTLQHIATHWRIQEPSHTWVMSYIWLVGSLKI